MLIDWFTVGAQVANFLILIWLLKRFLYQPILHAVDAREKRITEELAGAAAKERQAEAERLEFQRRNQAFDQQRTDLLNQAQNEAKAERQRRIDEARHEAEAWRFKLKEEFQREEELLTSELTRRTGEEVFAIARKTLSDLAGTTLEAQVSALFMRRMRELDGESKHSLAEAINTSSTPAIVRSAFDLPAELRRSIQIELQTLLATEIAIRFQTAPEVISGIELTANGQKISWSIAGYLGALEKCVSELLKDPFKAEPAVQNEPEHETQTAREETR